MSLYIYNCMDKKSRHSIKLQFIRQLTMYIWQCNNVHNSGKWCIHDSGLKTFIILFNCNDCRILFNLVDFFYRMAFSKNWIQSWIIDVKHTYIHVYTYNYKFQYISILFLCGGMGHSHIQCGYLVKEIVNHYKCIFE